MAIRKKDLGLRCKRSPRSGRYCAWFKKGSGTVVRSTLRAVPATVPDPFLNRSLPLEGAPASSGPGLRTASWGQEDARWNTTIARESAAMTDEFPKGMKTDLALAIAQGKSVALWARNHQVPESTA